MTEQQKPRPRPAPPKKGQRIVLPFENRQTDAGTWAYDHRIGLLITVAAYLLFGIVFVSSKIVVTKTNHMNTIILDMAPEQVVQPPRELTPEERQQLMEDLSNVRNRVSDENAQEDVDPARAARNAIPDDIADAEREIAERMSANRAAYQRGLQEEQDIINSRNNQPAGADGSSQNNQDAKVAGNVIISYDLAGRNAVYLYKPAYQCEGGAQVVVSIGVDRNGNVVSASVQSTTSTNSCFTERATQAARQSRFNVDAGAPSRQDGTITYLFVPQ